MPGFGRYRTELLSTAPEKPKSASQRLALKGFTVLTYCLARVTPDISSALMAEAKSAAHTYDGVFWHQGTCQLTALGVIGSVNLTGDWTPSDHADVRTHYVSASPNHVLAVTAWCLYAYESDSRPLPMPAIRLRNSSMPTALEAIGELTEPRLLHQTAELVAKDLGISTEAVSPVHDAVAVDIWDLAGSQALPAGTVFSAPDHVPPMAYEISALLSRTTRHISDDGRWSAQSPDRVYAELRYSYSFLTIAAAFANAHTCVEVSDVANTGDREYRDRLALLGYDSTANFVWTIEILRGEVLRELNGKYARITAELLDHHNSEPTDAATVSARVSRDQATVEALEELPRGLREGRHRALSEDVSMLRGSDEDLRSLSRRMSSYETLTRGIRQARADHRRNQVNLVLSIFGAAIAIAGLTQIGELVYSWYEGSDVVRPLITLALLALAAVSTILVWWRVGPSPSR